MWIRILTSGWTYALLMGALFGWQLLKNEQLQSTYLQEKLDAAIALSDAVAKARQDEQRKAQQYVDAVDKLTKDNEALHDEKDSILADLHNANVRLRRRFSCPASSVSVTPGPTAGSNGAETSGLLVEDAEFLVRLAAEADARVNQLTACQAVLKDRTQ